MIRRKFVIGLLVALAAFAGILVLSGWHSDRQVAAHLVREAMVRLWPEARTVDEFHRKHGRMPKDAAEAGLFLHSSMFIREMRYTPGELTAVLQGGGARYEGKMIRLAAQPGAQGLTWRCSASEGFPPAAFSGSSCLGEPGR